MNKRGTMLYPEEDRRYIQFTEEQLKRLADLYLSGHSTLKLGAMYGISACTVSRRLASMGVQVREQGKWRRVTDDVLAVAVALRDSGAPWRVVGWATGVCHSSIMSAMLRERKQLQQE